MNQIAWLEKNIAEMERFLAQDQDALALEPDDVCGKLALVGTENHLADLRHQLDLAQKERKKERKN